MLTESKSCTVEIVSSLLANDVEAADADVAAAAVDAPSAVRAISQLTNNH